MPDYDPKNIPILDDIIEDESDDATAIHEKIIVTDEMQADDNTFDLFNDETAGLDIDDTEPEIGAIDKFINAAPEDDSETQAVQAAAIESALIDFPYTDEVETNAEPEAENALTAKTSTTQQEQTPAATELLMDSEADTETESAITLDAIIDDVVTQLMPELEQQLRSRLKQALQEQLPQENIEPEKSNL